MDELSAQADFVVRICRTDKEILTRTKHLLRMMLGGFRLAPAPRGKRLSANEPENCGFRPCTPTYSFPVGIQVT